MYRLQANKINDFVKILNDKYPVFLPVKKANETNYDFYNKDSEIDFETLKTVKSCKDVFFPQTEDLVKFNVEGTKIEVINLDNDVKPFIVMGVRACDFKSFEVLDNVFLVDPIDTFYKAKREKAIIFTYACSNPDECCFCNALNIDASNPQGDVTMWKINDIFYFNPNTEKGAEILSEVSLLEKCDENAVDKEKDNIKSIINKLPFSNIKPQGFSEDMLDTFHDTKWNKLSEACLGCGTCTFVCPTCQCFDIREFVGNDNTVNRFRCWDSCMYNDFTKTAGGQPRPTQMQRFRQRFMHKLVYYPSNNKGLISCVGCGRCVKKCPQHLNIVKVIKAFNGDKNE